MTHFNAAVVEQLGRVAVFQLLDEFSVFVLELFEYVCDYHSLIFIRPSVLKLYCDTELHALYRHTYNTPGAVLHYEVRILVDII